MLNIRKTFFNPYLLLTMKTYNLWELLESPKWQKILTENLPTYADEDVVFAILELNYWKYDVNRKEDVYTFEDLENAIEDVDKITRYRSIDDYFDSCDDCLCFTDPNSVEARYFDYDAFHRDCEYDITEASNWVVLMNY